MYLIHSGIKSRIAHRKHSKETPCIPHVMPPRAVFPTASPAVPDPVSPTSTGFG